ncbi:MAG: hypothetical protein JXB48_02565 [Candidatus Latescibacteria bacterium]|nr:hypothetical protein [Candidatus Latescibacterota bacterium]
MSRFSPLLQRMNERITLPQPEKSRVLQEMAGDLDELYELYLSRGYDELEAQRLAEEKVEAGDETITLLIQLNDTFIRKLLRRLSELTQKRMETISWVTLLVLLCMAFTMKIMNSELISDSIFVWILSFLAISLFGVSVSKYYSLYIKKDHEIERLHSGLSLIFFLGALSLLTGLNGFFYELHKAFINTAKETDKMQIYISIAIQRSLALIAVGFVIAVCAALVWFIFTLKTLSIEQYEKSILYRD